MEKEITYSVYITQNLLEPTKAYVGMTNGHNKHYMGSSLSLQSDIQRLGRQNFTKSILGTFNDMNECHYWEGFYVKSMHTHISEGGYNKTYSGGAYTIRSIETITKINIANTGQKRSIEQRANISEGHKGHKPSDEAREHMRFAQKDKKLSTEHRKKISLSLKGHKQSDESKAKNSLTQKGHKLYVGEDGKRHWRRSE